MSKVSALNAVANTACELYLYSSSRILSFLFYFLQLQANFLSLQCGSTIAIMVSSFVSALFVASAAARFTPRSSEPPMRLADRQSSNFARIQQTADGSVPRFGWEDLALTDATIEDALASVSTDARSFFQFASQNIASDSTLETESTFNGRECKVFPGDEDWPADASWSALNDVTNGALLKPLPQAHVCYNTSLAGADQSACDAMTKSWTDPFSQYVAFEDYLLIAID